MFIVHNKQELENNTNIFLPNDRGLNSAQGVQILCHSLYQGSDEWHNLLTFKERFNSAFQIKSARKSVTLLFTTKSRFSFGKRWMVLDSDIDSLAKMSEGIKYVNFWWWGAEGWPIGGCKIGQNGQNGWLHENKKNQSPKGKMWSAVPLPCFDISMSQPFK